MIILNPKMYYKMHATPILAYHLVQLVVLTLLLYKLQQLLLFGPVVLLELSSSSCDLSWLLVAVHLL